jgi:hypothetical protein
MGFRWGFLEDQQKKQCAVISKAGKNRAHGMRQIALATLCNLLFSLVKFVCKKQQNCMRKVCGHIFNFLNFFPPEVGAHVFFSLQRVRTSLNMTPAAAYP